MKYRNDLKKRILAGLLAGAALCLAAPAAQAAGSPVSNGTLPDGGKFVAGQGTIGDPVNGKMDIHQNTQNAVITWDKGFNIGANATVNFTAEGAYKDNFNTLNYDKSGSLSQIYGTINAQGGNIYIVNPAGVEIGNSAQINTGSLYVSNKNLDDALKNINTENPDIPSIINAGTTTDAALMSLGNINANTVTFEGNRIVIDTERIKDESGDTKLVDIDHGQNITIRTTNENNVVIGYKGYDEDNKAYDTKEVTYNVTKIDEKGNVIDDAAKVAGYMWVEDVEQLQAIKDNLDGNYALRNSIDATATQDWNVNAGTVIKEGFQSLGTSAEAFTGKFDGLDYNIFNLNINRGAEDNVGLFGVVGSGAVINNVTLVGGSITGHNYVGSLAGAVRDGASISNITNSAKVNGSTSVGGIIGQSGNYSPSGKNEGASLENLINTGTVTGDTNNIGGLIGNMSGGSLGGTSYNLGAVTAKGYNVGGLVGHAYNATIGNQGEDAVTVYNRLNVTGAYNVGGIVGNMEGSTVQNAENSGNVTAEGFANDGRYKGSYTFHTANTADDYSDGTSKTVDVNTANVGGIVGISSSLGDKSSTISDVLNTGNVSSALETNQNYYTAGNVGGIVGSAVDTDITNATNRENEIRGAHNVGGIAGYFSGSGTVTNGINDGGDIMATGARYNDAFVTEIIRPVSDRTKEEFIIGNMGGIVGYMEGDNVFITGSANRGTVHTHEPENSSNVQDYEKAANVGGIVGKIDRSSAADEQDKQAIRDDYSKAAVSNSYNTGDVMGYTGVGGIAGMMYNGEIAGSYNLGYLRTTRQSTVGGSIDALNMGGIVGDTTENSNAKAFLYDVYNKGQIGDSEFNYFGRHVGGIVGRLSGDVEKAYNTGAIYNGYNVVGGIAGWLSTGNITNAFNTGNITVVNRNNGSSQVGGIVGAASTNNADIKLVNVYNLGTLRSFKDAGNNIGGNTVGGILGIINGNGAHQVSISNAYTTGNIWAGTKNTDGTYSEDQSNAIRSIWGRYEGTATADNISTTNTYYIRPDDGLPFTDLSANNRDNSNKAIDFDKKDDIGQYEYEGGRLFQEGTEKGNVNEGDAWRIYDGSTPILNAFLPNAKDYFDKEETDKTGIGSIQYGTAYDPLLTIINANKDLSFNWQDLGINNDAGLAVYGAGLTLNGFMSTGGSGYFGGLIYSDGALNINADKAKNPDITGNVALGSSSQLYGSSVTIDADGQVTIYGSVTATGNGTAADDDPDTSGSISITGGSVDVYGQLTSAEAEKDVFVPGINGMAADWTPGDVHDPYEVMSDIGDRFGYTTGASAVTGNISITANDAEDGHVNVYYGNKGEGIVTTGGNLTVTASGDIYMDSDLSIGGNLTLNAGQITNPDGTTSTAEGSEAVLDISNIGKVQAANDDDASHTSNYYLNEFLTHFADEKYNITLGGDKTKLAVDMWGDGAFDLTKYDYDRHTLAERINELNLEVNGKEAKGQDYTYIWVSTGEQLAGIQQYYEQETAAGGETNILSYNFALKNDIDASNVRDYKAIGAGTTDGYTGTFDGRDNRIIGLTMTGTNAGIFDTIGTRTDNDGKIHTGTVEDLRIYSGTFSGANNAGAIAGVNEGNISNVTAFGNVVDVNNQTGNDSSYAGGIAGTNSGSIDNASAIGTATQSSKDIAGSAEAAAGGIAGLNSGTISNSSANSAVNASAGNATALGGVAGVNTDTGTLNNVDSLGVTTGVYKVQGQNTLYSDNVGGIAGTNSGTVKNVYNESIVSGRDNVGGILGVNTATTTEDEGSPVSNVANASRVTGEADSSSDTNNASDYVGGLVGNNEGSITNGRNNGEITGNNYVGGLVGSNGANSTLTNLVNDSAAAITGDNYVGGIAGSNEGTISAKNQTNLINRGSITGQNYVGGVAGENIGTIEYVESDISLNVRYEDQEAKYFGGVAGINTDSGTITNATNRADVSADGASYVGGVVGKNDGVLSGMNGNYGTVSGKDFVGGVAGENTQALSGVNAVNQGDVTAKEGGAGGIFAVNSGEITDSTFTSSGTVSGTTGTGASGTGGIFGVNEKNITNSVLENKTGTVTGTSNTGGLIGINTGDVSTSSLKNEADIKVEGDNVSNIGGLIGMNTGDITGGRTDAEGNDAGYYKYQIYNNGTITVEGDGSNIGGLIGNNAQENGKTGSLTAGYNTGAIVAKNGTNVGGIAGTNAGTLDQVFNTVITGVNEDGSITGSTNVGGIAGTNTGSISNAYNTTEVNGTTNTGSIVGTNSNTADDSIRNVYGTGTLVGDNSNVTNGYNTTEDGNWTTSGSYGGFDFDSTDTDGTESIWKIYEGSTNPLLKVFLTQLTVNETAEINGQTVTLNDYLNLVYNGKEQDINIQDLINKGFITGPDGMKDTDGNSFVFDAYNNTKLDGENPLGNSALLQNTTGQKYADKYDNWLTSTQISAGNGTVNNLGYDIDLGTRKVDKAQISISLDEIHRTYGNEAITNITQNTTDYGFTISNVDAEAGLTEEMESDLAGLTFTQGSIFDDAVDNLTGEQKTDNAGNYNWKASFDLGEDTSEDSLAHNFEFVVNGQGATEIIVENGVSKVNQANLTIDLKDVNMIYGQKEDAIRGQYGYSASTETGKTLVNGDSLTDVIAGMTYTNTAYNADGTTKDVLADGTYALEKDTVTEGDAYKNYNVTYTNGDVTMGKASVVISADDKEMHVGDTIPAFTGKDISSQLVNGDTLSGWYYEPEGTVDSSVGGSHIIGVHFGNGKYAGSDSFDWTTAWDGFKNYNVTFTPGMLTVRDFPEGMPDIPEIPGIENHWNGLLGDNPWDRNRDFRERKAEIHYIAGGMTL